ncbi:MAG: hypothetical protein AAF533_20030 [Acidobacteriota bacterium]
MARDIDEEAHAKVLQRLVLQAMRVDNVLSTVASVLKKSILEWAERNGRGVPSAFLVCDLPTLLTAIEDTKLRLRRSSSGTFSGGILDCFRSTDGSHGSNQASWRPPEETKPEQQATSFSITVTWLGDSIDANRFSELAWRLSHALSLVDGVKVVVDSLGTGSAWLKVRLFFKNIFAEQQVAEILDKARNSAESRYLEQPRLDAEKAEAEADKLRTETSRLEREASLLASPDEAAEDRALEREAKRLALRRERLEQAKLQFELLTTASQLIADGILGADPVQIAIGDGEFLSLNQGKFIAGQSAAKLITDEKQAQPSQNRDPRDGS